MNCACAELGIPMRYMGGAGGGDGVHMNAAGGDICPATPLIAPDIDAGDSGEQLPGPPTPPPATIMGDPAPPPPP